VDRVLAGLLDLAGWALARAASGGSSGGGVGGPAAGALGRLGDMGAGDATPIGAFAGGRVGAPHLAEWASARAATHSPCKQQHRQGQCGAERHHAPASRLRYQGASRVRAAQ
jgi:hypothetical protein